MTRPFRIRFALHLALTLTIGLWAGAAIADPIAIVAAVKGKVEVTPNGAKTAVRASFGLPLERGDRLVVERGGSATLAFGDGNVVELAENSSLTVGGRMANRAQAGPGAGLPNEVFTQVSKFVTGGSRQAGLVAMAPLRSSLSAAEGMPLIVGPRSSEVMSGRPAFTWRQVKGAMRYKVVVSGDEGELWRREVSGTSLDYPADAAPLAADADVLWEVQAWSDGGQIRKESSSFHVLAADQAEAVRTHLDRIRAAAGGDSSPASHYLAGSYLASRGIYDDAGRQFEALSKIDPDSPAPHEALGNVYRAVGLMDLAAAEFEKALTLTREQ
ncbi:MAG: hypothetical protein A2W00_07590 [Candidatus Eisenbacteria bacterium RBG_16_71_46]|nr:MAG: hypothetical protein A2W00_07590 [Candidatus Eisenbacteria bacterium RBG_16_71_46]